MPPEKVASAGFDQDAVVAGRIVPELLMPPEKVEPPKVKRFAAADPDAAPLRSCRNW